MQTRSCGLSIGLFCCLVLAACGEDGAGDGQACEPLVPCGGELVGTWEIESICVSDEINQAFEQDLPAECAGSVTRTNVTLGDATLEYTADGTLTSSGTASVLGEYRFSEACLAAALADFPGLSEAACADLVNDPDLGLQEDTDSVETTCRLATGACECSISQDVDTASTGSYAVMNDQIIVGGLATPFCVTGDELRYGDPMLGVSTARRR